MKTATTSELIEARHCKTCRRTTPHGHIADGDKERNIIRCHNCGQRPDRPKDGSKIKTLCPNCDNQKKITATYHDEDGIDCFRVPCPECGDYMRGYDEISRAHSKARAAERARATAAASTMLKSFSHISGLSSVTVTVGCETATARRK